MRGGKTFAVYDAMRTNELCPETEDYYLAERLHRMVGLTSRSLKRVGQRLVSASRELALESPSQYFKSRRVQIVLLDSGVIYIKATRILKRIWAGDAHVNTQWQLLKHCPVWQLHELAAEWRKQGYTVRLADEQSIRIAIALHALKRM